jgi:hypothetical protein
VRKSCQSLRPERPCGAQIDETRLTFRVVAVRFAERALWKFPAELTSAASPQVLGHI